MALATVSGGWVWAPVAVSVSLGVLGVSIGVGNVISARAPQPMPTSTNLFATNTNQGCVSGLLQLVSMLVQGLLLIPVAVGVAVAVVWWPPGMVLVIPLVLAWGFLWWRIGLGHAVRWLTPRQAELLATLSPRRTG